MKTDAEHVNDDSAGMKRSARKTRGAKMTRCAKSPKRTHPSLKEREGPSNPSRRSSRSIRRLEPRPGREPSNLEAASNREVVIQAHAAAEALMPVGTDEMVLRICEAIW
jgi:hypothetical protein